MESHLDQTGGFSLRFTVCFGCGCFVHAVDKLQEDHVVPRFRARPADACADRGRDRGRVRGRLVPQDRVHERVVEQTVGNRGGASHFACPR